MKLLDHFRKAIQPNAAATEDRHVSKAKAYWLGVFNDAVRWSVRDDKPITTYDAPLIVAGAVYLADAALIAVEARWGEVPE